jgi:hypothetical protein
MLYDSDAGPDLTLLLRGSFRKSFPREGAPQTDRTTGAISDSQIPSSPAENFERLRKG